MDITLKESPFKGKKDCPVEDELNAIEANLTNFNQNYYFDR